MGGNLIIEHATIVTPTGNEAVSGKKMRELYQRHNSFILISDGKIEEIGPMKSVPDLDSTYRRYNAGGCVVLPGFIDSHTHLVFGGLRADEFECRLRGESYMSIMEKGGGIQATVNSTRQASSLELNEKARFFLKRMSEMGVTTVEIKSGYGLDVSTELKMLEVIENLIISEKSYIRILPTYMGAHAVPSEFSGKKSDYIKLLIDNLALMKKKAIFFDVFCEKNVFEIEETRLLLEEARKHGFKLKLHADEIVPLGGAELAAEMGTVSADHLLHVSDTGIKKMAEAGVVATLLPLTAFALKEPYAPARKLIDCGCSVALATDLNPGSCFSGSIPLTIALACIYMNMSVEETITALTINGAAALNIAHETGSIEEGKRGDVVILNCNNYKILPYYIGMNCVKTTVFNGNIVNSNF